MAETQWEELLGNRDDEDVVPSEEDVDEIQIYGIPEPPRKKGDWIGLQRDRRSAFLILAALRYEGML